MQSQIFAGILYVLQEDLTKQNEKKTSQAAFWRLLNRSNAEQALREEVDWNDKNIEEVCRLYLRNDFFCIHLEYRNAFGFQSYAESG